MMADTYYKVIAANGKSPTTKFDYSPFLPHGKRKGKWLPKIESAKIRKEGYYVSKFWNMWFSTGMKIYVAETRGIILPDGVGAENQACCAQIRLIEDVTEKKLTEFFISKTIKLDVEEASKTEFHWNVGNNNSGLRNIGDSNTGNFNIGSRNTGNLNLGDFNTGDKNRGIDNVGDNNLGTGNVGCSNEGHSNAGSFNKGSFNCGAHNKGNGNSGSFNTGSHNVGKWNIGDCNLGFFNTQTAPFRIFDMPAPDNISFYNVRLPKFLYANDTRKAFYLADKAEVRAALALPNFSYDIFEKITGISRADFEKKLGMI